MFDFRLYHQLQNRTVIQGDSTAPNFDVLLTLHLSIILAINQLNAQILVLY